MNHQPDVNSLTDDLLDTLFVAVLNRDDYEYETQAWQVLSLRLEKRAQNLDNWPLITSN